MRPYHDWPDRDEEASRWSITVHNRSGLLITDVQFPFIVVRYHLGGEPGTEALLWPFSVGRLYRAPQPQHLHPDTPLAWQFRPENGDTGHYPGLTFAQFLAYYNDHAGVYVACEDSAGSVKLIKPVHCGKGIRLGLAHVGDWPTNGSRPLGYDVVLRTFTGDWYDAAGLYRQWSLQQHWARRPWHKRTDLPAWLLDSPPHIVFRIQGELDLGPAEPNSRPMLLFFQSRADRLRAGPRTRPALKPTPSPTPSIPKAKEFNSRHADHREETRRRARQRSQVPGPQNRRRQSPLPHERPQTRLLRH